jgi:hypothetical protein
LAERLREVGLNAKIRKYGERHFAYAYVSAGAIARRPELRPIEEALERITQDGNKSERTRRLAAGLLARIRGTNAPF